MATDRLEERQAKYGSGDYRTISARRCLARAYAAANQLDEAANLFNEVIASFANTHGPEHPSTLETMQWLADVRRQAGKFEESVDLLQRTLTGQQHTLGPEHPDTLTTMIQLGSLLTTQSEYARAEPLLRDGYIGFAKRGEANPTPFDREQTRKACAQLVQLFEKSGHPDKATAWKQKLAALTAEPKKDEGNK